jgi:hypothetical protein
MSPLANSYLVKEELQKPESYYPLKAYVCRHCFLVQLEEIQSPENIFQDYAYFSSYSDSWVKHANTYVQSTIKNFGLTPAHFILEVASNDGYLLRHFHQQGFSVLGIEPAENVAKVAETSGIPTLSEFFGENTAKRLARLDHHADLFIANNVLAHVPEINDFVAGTKIILKSTGLATFEFPSLLNLIQANQFDTIYHEHYSYLSLSFTKRLFEKHGLEVFHVEELKTHGGSLRVYVKHREDPSKIKTPELSKILANESQARLDDLVQDGTFQNQVNKVKRDLLDYLIQLKRKDMTIVGYGAPAKGNTLLNFCGIQKDFLDYTVDRNPYKQGRFLPGSHIPIYSPDKIKESKPNYILILPWNLKEEIVEQLSYIRSWGGKFIVPIPQVEILE